LAASAGAESNGVLREVWLNIGGTAVADLTNNAAFPSTPSFDEVMTSGFEAPTDVSENYGQRLRALLLPPTTGKYYFFTASDDASQLYLSTDDTPANRRLIARVDGWTAARVRMTDGVLVTNLSITSGQPPGGDATSPDSFPISASLFVPGTNVTAVEVHQNQLGSSDITFGLQLSADFAGATNAVALATPGAANSVRAELPGFGPVWLNEMQADNQTGPQDNYGERDPWVELYSAGTNALSLGGYGLSDNYSNLARWSFPSNVTIAGGGFLVVWCDGQTNQGTEVAPHAGFGLGLGGGRVALSRRVGGTNQLVDYLTCPDLPSNWSYGDVPDGQPSLSATQTFRVTVYLQPVLGVVIEGEQLRLTWPRGTLQEADEAAGPYRDVTTLSPFTVDLTESRRFLPHPVARRRPPASTTMSWLYR